MEVKAVVTFAGARDGYQLPLALREADLLEALVTDMYWPRDRAWFCTSFGKVIPDRLLRARFCDGLESTKVQVPRRACVISGFQQVAPKLALNRYTDKSLSRKSRSLAMKKGAAMFCCSYYAFEAFKDRPSCPPFRFLFQLHPHPKTVRTILVEELDRIPMAKSSLSAEPELSLPQRYFQALCSEPHLANGWVVASTFTAKSLIEQGIPCEKIHVVPYGVDDRAFQKRSCPPASCKPFTIIFVGSLVQRKGLSYLLEAVRLLNSHKIRVVLCGRGVSDRFLINQYSDLNIEVCVGLDREQLVRRIHDADILVLPSLAEGFGHVILEAMSCGVPVVATPHTCAPDVIKDGVNGFLVPIRDPEAIAVKLSWGIDNRKELAAIGESAAYQARSFTWQRFRIRARAAYKAMLASAS